MRGNHVGLLYMGHGEGCYIVQDCHKSCALELLAKGDVDASTFEHETYDDTMLLCMTQCSQGRQQYRQDCNCVLTLLCTCIVMSLLEFVSAC